MTTKVPESFLREVPAYDRDFTITVGYIRDSGYFYDIFQAGSERPLEQVGELTLPELMERTHGVVNWRGQRVLYLNLMAAPHRLAALHDMTPAAKIVLDLLGS